MKKGQFAELLDLVLAGKLRVTRILLSPATARANREVIEALKAAADVEMVESDELADGNVCIATAPAHKPATLDALKACLSEHPG